MISDNRDEIRRFIAAAWRKWQAGEGLAPLERLVAAAVSRHPEYHHHLADDEAVLAAGADATAGRDNPFLHLGMHIALEEQIQADRPQGVRLIYRQLVGECGDPHAAEHRMMDCLGNALREAQRRGAQPDEDAYLACLIHRRAAHDH